MIGAVGTVLITRVSEKTKSMHTRVPNSIFHPRTITYDVTVYNIIITGSIILAVSVEYQLKLILLYVIKRHLISWAQDFEINLRYVI